MSAENKEEIECLMQNVADVSSSLDDIVTAERDDLVNLQIDTDEDRDQAHSTASNIQTINLAIHHLAAACAILQTIIDKN